MSARTVALALLPWLLVACSSSSSSSLNDKGLDDDGPATADGARDQRPADPDAARDGAPRGDGDAGAPIDLGPLPDGFDPSVVVINEVAPKGAPEDWFELYNRSSYGVALDQYTFSDDPARGSYAAFPAGAVIAPHGYLVVEMTDAYPGFKLAGNETLVLATAAQQILDEVDLTPFAAGAGKSVGRLPDGIGAFQLLNAPTPGQPNMQGTDDVIPAGFCPQGPGQCADGSGCVQGKCGPCQDDAHCRAEDRCLSGGSCGACGPAAPCGADETCRHGFCLPKEVAQWSVQVDPLLWQQMVGDPWNTALSAPCTLGVGTAAYKDTCSLRIHGGSSRDYPKKSLRITFDENKPHPGFSRKITLRAEYNDASFLRNVLAHAMFRRFTTLPVARTRFVRLDLNGAYYGLFVEVERIGPKMLRENGRDDTAPTYEADAVFALASQGASSFVPLPDAATYAGAYTCQIGDVTNYAPLIDLVEKQIWPDYLDSSQGQAISRIPQALHYPGFLDYLALMGVIQNQDHVQKNYYFSLQPASNGTPRWEFYPYDLDLTFGCLWDPVAEDTICDDLKTQEDYAAGIVPPGVIPGYPADEFYNLLNHLVLTDPAAATTFGQRVCAVLGSPFWQTRLHGYIDGLRELIEPAVLPDPNDRNADLPAFAAAVAELHTFVDQRGAYLGAQLGCPTP